MKQRELRYTGEAIPWTYDRLHLGPFYKGRGPLSVFGALFLRSVSTSWFGDIRTPEKTPAFYYSPSRSINTDCATGQNARKLSESCNCSQHHSRLSKSRNYNKEKGYSEVTINCNEARKVRHFNHTEKEPLSKTHFHLTHDVPPLPKIPFSDCPEIRMATRRNEGPFI